MKKILLRIVHVGDNGDESIMYQEDIGESVDLKHISVLNKAFELADTIKKATTPEVISVENLWGRAVEEIAE